MKFGDLIEKFSKKKVEFAPRLATTQSMSFDSLTLKANSRTKRPALASARIVRDYLRYRTNESAGGSVI